MANRAEVNALAVDDDADDRLTLERLGNYGVNCKAIPPPSPASFQQAIFDRINRGEVDVVLLDFRLDDSSAGEDLPASYRGGMLAAAIKEWFPAIPIVLVTTEQKRRELVEANPRIRSLFDYILLKSAISGRVTERKAVAAQIVDLASGFKEICRVLDGGHGAGSWDTIGSLLGIDDQGLTLVKQAIGGIAPGTPAEVASWLLQGLLFYPGPLLGANEARSRLGLTFKAFEKGSVQGWAGSAKYSGVFGQLFPRWWEHSLLELLRKVAGDDATGEARVRAAAIARDCGETRLQPARCVWCRRGLVQRACHLCQEAVDATHHLLVRVDARPAWSLPALVCFSCIATGRDQEDPSIRFGPGTGRLLEELRGTR